MAHRTRGMRLNERNWTTMDAPLKLVVVLPAHNEERTVGQVVEGVPRNPAGIAETEVIVVNDGSTDRTEQMARERGAGVINLPRRRGVGAAVQAGLAEGVKRGADIIVNIDADGQFDPGDIPLLIEPILAGRAGFVTASRFARADYVPEMPWIKRWGNRRMSRLVNFATGTTDLTDVSCGFRAFSADAALKLHLTGSFTHVQETIIDLASKGVRMAEVPVRVRGVREHGRSRVANNLLVYAIRTGGRIVLTMCRTRPILFFGSISALLLSLGVLQGVFLLVHWLLTGRTSPFRALLVGSSLFIILGFAIGLLALLADMVRHQIDTSEHLLYFERVKRHRRAQEENGAGSSGSASEGGA